MTRSATKPNDRPDPLDGRFVEREEPSLPDERRVWVALDRLAAACEAVTNDGGRLVSVFEARRPQPSIAATFAHRGQIITVLSPIAGAGEYPAIAAMVPAAEWPERELHDLTGIVPVGHPDLRPLISADADRLAPTLSGDDVFIIPYGPIRSGVFEAVQFIIETGGEDIPVVDVRPGFKRRSLEQRFAGASGRPGVALAERVAGVATVAHAVAFCQALERIADVAAPSRAQLWRVVHAELERVAHHLHVAAALAETTALSVGQARFLILKEDVMRLRAHLCGSRFGRGVVVPGGLGAEPAVGPADIETFLEAFERDLRRDQRLLLGTTSFTDRLFGTGRVDRETVERFGGVGPVARACGVSTDARFERPYDAYNRLGFEVVTRGDGDAMARLEVHLAEIRQSVHLIRQALDRLERAGGGLCTAIGAPSGVAHGWSEAPQGEVVYALAVEKGVCTEAHIASASYRNWPLFAASFRGDVLTDFGFIEHSFGLTAAEADR
jgi:formate hydrogenlyase subunit 5